MGDVNVSAAWRTCAKVAGANPTPRLVVPSAAVAAARRPGSAPLPAGEDAGVPLRRAQREPCRLAPAGARARAVTAAPGLSVACDGLEGRRRMTPVEVVHRQGRERAAGGGQPDVEAVDRLEEDAAASPCSSRRPTSGGPETPDGTTRDHVTETGASREARTRSNRTVPSDAGLRRRAHEVPRRPFGERDGRRTPAGSASAGASGGGARRTIRNPSPPVGGRPVQPAGPVPDARRDDAAVVRVRQARSTTSVLPTVQYARTAGVRPSRNSRRTPARPQAAASSHDEGALRELFLTGRSCHRHFLAALRTLTMRLSISGTGLRKDRTESDLRRQMCAGWHTISRRRNGRLRSVGGGAAPNARPGTAGAE